MGYKGSFERNKKPLLMMGAKYDTTDFKVMEVQSKLVQRGRYLYCSHVSHFAMRDDQPVFMKGVIRFIKDVATNLIK